ncbi:MAG: hypothetical protein WAV31_02875 [Candidatus Moraniibacteriota bacterium]
MEEEKGILDIIAEDCSLITYRPSLNKITGSVTSTILLQQALHYWKNIGKKKFYKFKEPCNHKKYKQGDSWVETLGFTTKEFDGALKRIAFKKGKTKNVISKENALIIYYRDKDGLTWYEPQEEKIKELLGRIYSVNDKKEYTKKEQKGEIPSKSEKVAYPISEINSEIKSKIECSNEVASDLTELSSFKKGNLKANSFSEQKFIKEGEKQERIEKYKEAVELGIYFENFLGMPMPDNIIYVSTKKEELKEVDLNIQAGKRMIKKYGKEKIELLIRLFFELKKEVPADKKKYIIVIGNLFDFEKKLGKVFSFIENQGVNPHTGIRFKNAKPNTTFDEMIKGKVIRKDKW